MSKHRRKKKTRSPRKGQIQSSDFVVVKNPLSDVPHDIVLKGLIEAGKAYQEEFGSDLARVVTLIQAGDALQTIATLSVYGLFAGMTDSGKKRVIHKDESFNQSHVELVQAIALQIPAQKHSAQIPDPTAIQELFDLLPKLGNSFHLQHLIALEKSSTDQEKTVLMLQEHLRIHTQSVRNWGYLKRVITIAKRLYEPINPLFQKFLGTTVTELIDSLLSLDKKN